MSTALDAASKGVTTVITGLRASCTTNVANGARADAARNGLAFPAGQNRYWFEITADRHSVSPDYGFGITSLASPDYATLLSGPPNSLIAYRSGTIWLNNVNTGITLGGSIGSTDSVMFGLDLDNNLLFAKVSTQSNWNGIIGANPDTGVSGIDISAITATGIYAVGVFASLADAFIANFGGSVPVNTPPSTYASYDGTPPGAVTSKVRQNARMHGFTNHATALAVGGVSGYGYVGSLTLLATEAADVFVGECAPSNAIVMAATEAPDTWHVVAPARYNIGGLNIPETLSDDDVIYVLENNETIYVPGDFSSSFVIPSEDTLLAM